MKMSSETRGNHNCFVFPSSRQHFHALQHALAVEIICFCAGEIKRKRGSKSEIRQRKSLKRISTASLELNLKCQARERKKMFMTKVEETSSIHQSDELLACRF